MLEGVARTIFFATHTHVVNFIDGKLCNCVSFSFAAVVAEAMPGFYQSQEGSICIFYFIEWKCADRSAQWKSHQNGSEQWKSYQNESAQWNFLCWPVVVQRT